MQGFWRHPALPIGIVLLLLGVGNWMVSRSKVLEYERRARMPERLEQTSSLDGFARLTPRTNATLLERLHHRLGDYGFAAAKRDFYTVVHSGGRLIAVIGLLLIGVGLLQRWRERRVLRTTARPPLAPAAPGAQA
jgi:hypothetical protein